MQSEDGTTHMTKTTKNLEITAESNSESGGVTTDQSSNSNNISNSAQRGHNHRQTSEPLNAAAAIDANEEMKSTDRRSMYEQKWSTSHLGKDGRSVSAPVGPSQPPLRERLDTETLEAQDTVEYNLEDLIPKKRSIAVQQRLSLSPMELGHFNQSWATGDADDLFGASFVGPSVSFAGLSTAFGGSTVSFAGSSGYFGDSFVERPSSLRSAGSAPRVNSLGISSAIHDAARITNWDQVLKLCESNPDYAKYSGRDGWTALHHACNRRCPYPHVVEALLRANPDALLQECEKGWLPLHYACRFKAPTAVVRLLVYMYPEKGEKTVPQVDRLKRTPLWYAVRYEADAGVVGTLLEVDPGAVLEEDENSESPLALIWDSWVEKTEGKRIVNSFIPGGFPEREEYSAVERATILQSRLAKEAKLSRKWTQVNMLLKAAYGFPVEEVKAGAKSSVESETKKERKWRIVHATAAVKCHPSLFLLSCALYPEQVKELDEGDLFPKRVPAVGPTPQQTALHLAASSNAGREPGKTILLELLREFREAAEMPDGYDGSLPLHRMVENEQKQDWTNHAAILHRFYTRAVQVPDRNGKLPLHRAAKAIKHDPEDEQGEENIIVQLVRAFAPASSHADNEGCLPFHLIAQRAEIWDIAVDCVYNNNRNCVLARAGAEHFRRLPIHMAAASYSSRDSLISRLIQLNPRGASLVDSQGKLPLHLACEIGKDWNEGVHSIHSAFPNAVAQAEQNSRRWYPLHMAANAPDTSLELMEELVRLNLEAAGIPDAEGRYPLHLACQSGKTWFTGLGVLFDAFPSAMATPCHKGLYPFHIAALRYCKPMEEEEQNAVQIMGMMDKCNQQTLEKDAGELDILFNLLKADPTIVTSVQNSEYYDA